MTSSKDEEATPLIEAAVSNSSFCAKAASKSLRVTCYGSSSAKTPERYLKEARALGYILAKRGHVCVNGAGSFGCMAAMNDGAVAGNGHIVGVIHEMFLVDNGYFDRKDERGGGAHKAFRPTSSDGDRSGDGPIREILVAGGDDLQQRKKFLVDKADGLIVLPGGPGTWDELWEMACSRHLGLVQLPIVCVNVDGFYEPFQEMLDRAYEDELIKLKPHDIVHFASNAEEAVRWIEAVKEGRSIPKVSNPARRSSALRKSSFYSPLSLNATENDGEEKSSLEFSTLMRAGLIFAAGIVAGVAAARVRR
eukprot:CAMPEP_0117026780 /NCGR_PEP_ID=MMETSP0472-20121206/19655_1 /TAXON_ID=693140 ORGANISM="Tiarina fusus, Strain LIS" /NCGR_SAMPLE_ID=MMETSP0472 /ASSEMBLY_ACC=CAM_ASM_000603 /LENGTH=306 /DNA_ID=CAMNT_0004733881 /DNA_START=48 /DNA_END=968 /DNA_ORIENTATION=+